MPASILGNLPALWATAKSFLVTEVLISAKVARSINRPGKTASPIPEPMVVSLPVAPSAKTCTKRYAAMQRSVSPPLCRIKRSHEHDDNADEADKNTHRRKRVRRNAYTGKLKKRSPEAIAAVAAELQKQDRILAHRVGRILSKRPLHRIRPADGFPIVTARDEVIERMCTSEEDHAFELELILEAYTRQAGVEMSADEVDFFFSNLESVAYNARRLATWLRAEQATGKDRVGTLFLTRAGVAPGPTPNCDTPFYCATLSRTCSRVDEALYEGLEDWTLSFANAWALIAEDFVGRNLQDVLCAPVVRVLCGYPTLLKELLAATPEDHPDYEDVEQAIVVWERLGTTCRSYLPALPTVPSPVQCDSGYESEDETF